MGNQILRQPDGKYAIFSSITDTIIVWDVTEDEAVEYFAETAAEHARQDARRVITHVAEGNPSKAYYQFAMTWEEALDKDRRHRGTAWREFEGPGHG